MVILFKDRQAELDEVGREDAIRMRAETTAESMTPVQRMRLEAQYQQNPQLPVDAHVALALDPNGEALFEQVSMQHARQGMRATVGAPLTANQLRYLNASETEQNQIDRVYASIAGRLVNGPASGWQNAVAKISGAADGPAGLIQGALQQVPGSDTMYAGLKGFSRNVMPVLDAPMQLTQATGRQVAAGVTDVADGNLTGALGHLARAQIGGPAGLANMGLNMGQTDVGQWATERGQQAGGLINRALGRDYEINSDIGTGFFVNQGSDIVERRVAAERSMGVLPNGQTYTIGRSVATGVGFDPEGTSYNVLSGLLDATVAVGVPGVEGALARGLKGAGRGTRALLGGVDDAEFLARAGAHQGLYSQVDLDRAVDFVTSERASGLVDFMVNNSDDAGWMRIWEATNGNLDPYTVSRLADAKSPDDVQRILVAAIQNGGRPTLTTAPTRALQNISRAAQRGGTLRRLGGKVPERTINLADPSDAVNTVLDFGRNVKADRSMIDSWAAAMGRAPDEIARRNVYTQMLGDTAEMLSRGGIPEGRARSLTRYMQNELETSRALFEDTLQMSTNDWSVRAIGDGNLELPPITLLQEAASELPLPDARDLRRATSWARPLWELAEDPNMAEKFTRVLGKGWEGTFDGLMMLQSKWKDMRLLRLGYPLRVLPEEQLRRVAAGHTVLNHPAGLFGIMLDNPRIGDDVDDAMRGVRNALDGTALADDDIFIAAMADSRLAGLRDSGRTVSRTGPRTRVFASGNTDEFLVGWKDELMLLASDPVATRVSRGGVDETLEFLVGDGAYIRNKLVSLDGSLADDLTLRQYLETISNRIQATTGGSDELMSVVQRGEWPDSMQLADMMDYAPESVVMRGILNGDQVNAYDRVVGAIFDAIAAAPTNKLSRSPVFRSAYESRLVELASLAAKPDELLAAARRANVTDDAYRAIQAGIRAGGGRGTLQLTHLDTLAKKGALDEVRGLLYDVTRSSQFFDQARLLFPFGEAWKEVVTTWARLFANDPFTVQRFAGLTGRALTSNDTGQTYFDLAGLDQESDTGFFYENEYGDMVFYYPYSQELTEMLAGVPFRLEGGARNLNLAGEILPGLGPYAQVAAYNVLPNNTTWDPIREKLFPYGSPTSMATAIDYLPAWASTFVRGLAGEDQLTAEQQRLYGNTQMRVMRYLWSTGNYTSEDQERFWADVDSATQQLFLTRSFVQLAAPASPQVATTIIGPDGELLDQAFLMDEYLKLTEEDYETALEKFMAMYGEGALLIPQGNTVSTTYGGTPLEGAGYDWVRDNPEVADAHPELFGFFAPVGEGSEFSSEAYLRSLESGERIQLSNEEKLALAQHRWASNQYRRVRDLIEGNPTPEQQVLLDRLRADLKEQYPGYGRVEGIGGRDPVYEVIDSGDVDRALEDETLLATPVGQALETYWSFREQVVQAAAAEGFRTIGSGGWRSQNAAEPYRNLLRSFGDELATNEPEFARMWDLFLSQEFEEPEDE